MLWYTVCRCDVTCSGNCLWLLPMLHAWHQALQGALTSALVQAAFQVRSQKMLHFGLTMRLHSYDAARDRGTSLAPFLFVSRSHLDLVTCTAHNPIPQHVIRHDALVKFWV